jgi:DNA-binding response OmpR family regulator
MDAWASTEIPLVTPQPAVTSPTSAAFPAPTTESTAPSTIDGTGRRVLIIESDVPTADQLVTILEQANYTVEIATDSTYGLILLDSFDPELIVLGAPSPRLNSHEVTQAIRNAPQYSARFRSTPIIYIGDNKLLIQQRFHTLPDTPLSEYIFKPIDGTELLDKVSRVFAQGDRV